MLEELSEIKPIVDIAPSTLSDELGMFSNLQNIAQKQINYNSNYQGV